MTEALAEAPRPRFFVRVIETPAGAPWDQARAARLDALHGAPLPADQLVMQLRRIEPWHPSAAGRFAAAYGRAGDLAAEETHVAALDGRRVRFVFTPPGQLASRAKTTFVSGLLVVGLAAALILAGLRAHEARTSNDALIARLEGAAQLHERHQRRTRQLQAELRAVQAAGADGHSFSALATDLAWLGQAKAGAARIQRVVWSPGEMQVVALGPDVPVLGGERTIEPGEAQVAGAALWRIGGAPAPVVRGGVTRPNVVARPSVASSPSS